MSSAGPAIFLASKAVGAMATAQAGAARRREYEQQAEMAELKGRAEAIAYKQKGAEILGRLNETLAAIIARGAVGADPTSGSARTLATASTADGVTESNIAADNAIAAVNQGIMQAEQYREAGKTAQQTANMQAISSFGMGLYQYGKLIG
jgi:hypothetical protein